VDALEQHLDTIRSAHVKLLAALHLKLRTERGEVVSELLCECDDPRIFGSSMRFDAVVAGPQFFDVEIEEVPDLAVGLGLELDGARIGFGRFSWNDCRVQVRIAADAWDAPLRAWIATSMDLEDTREADRWGLSNVTHSVTELAHDGEVLRFTVDFGSAGIDALLELMSALVKAGASVVVFANNIEL
jgi:hypothetical protein